MIMSEQVKDLWLTLKHVLSKLQNWVLFVVRLPHAAKMCPFKELR